MAVLLVQAGSALSADSDSSSGGDGSPRLLGPAQIRQLAAEVGVRPTKTLGQNFVHDANTVRRIVAESGVGADDVVLEVGPGLGSLTLALLEQAGRVVAVEIDPVLAQRLPRTIAERAAARQGDFEVITADALRVTRDDLPVAPTALVANLPYNVAVPVLLHLLAVFPEIRTALVMVQAEVADRLAAEPGSRTYGVPSVKARYHGTVRRAGAVGRSVFWPEPKVESGLVRIERTDTTRSTTSCAARYSPSSTPHSPSAARRCDRRWPAGPVHPRRPNGVCAPQASTPVSGASDSASPISCASPKPTDRAPECVDRARKRR